MKQIRIVDSIDRTQTRREKKIKNILPKNLTTCYNEYSYHGCDIIISEPVNVGILFKNIQCGTPLIRVTYTNVRVHKKEQLNLGIEIAKELDMDEVIKSYMEE